MKMNDDIKTRILKSIGLAFSVDVSEMDISECTPQTIEEWDSLSFLNLVLLLEDEFGVSFDPDDITEMTEGGVKLLETVSRCVA